MNDINVLYHKEIITLNKGETRTITLRPNFSIPASDAVIVGISGFDFSFGSGTDHHVKHVFLNAEHKISSTKAQNDTLEIKVSCGMYDNSKHHATSTSIALCAVILNQKVKDDPIEIKAIRSFGMVFDDDDHHVQNVGASSQGAFMEDYSGHEARGEVCVDTLNINADILAEMQKNGIYFINSFYMSNNTDHHISQLSVNVDAAGTKTFVMSDKSDNRAAYKQCSVNNEKTPDTLLRIMNVSLHGTNRNLKANSDKIGNLVESHIQGVAKYNKHYILTHNNKGYSTGRFIIVQADGKGFSTMAIPFDGYNHPGGVQRYKNYLVVALEDANNSKSMILFYKMDDLAINNKPTLCEGTTIKRYKRTDPLSGVEIGTNEAAAAVGVCFDAENNQYIVGVYNPHEPPSASSNDSVKAYLDIYEAKAKNGKGETIELDSAVFERKKTVHFGFNTGQGIGLIRDNDGELYLLKFKSPFEKTNNVDAINIYRISKSEVKKHNGIPLHSFEKVACRHMYTSPGGTTGEVHFRWGTGLEVADDGAVTLLATRRNCLGGWVWINDFT